MTRPRRRFATWICLHCGRLAQRTRRHEGHRCCFFCASYDVELLPSESAAERATEDAR